MTTQSLPYASGKPQIRGIVRQQPEDFRVQEQLGFDADGEGEHVLLHVRKKGLTTFQLVRALSQRTGVRERDIGFCGMKDRDAVTEQYLSLFLRKENEPHWPSLDIPGVTILAARRHGRKLRRGSHRGNHFQLVIRQLSGDWQSLSEKLDFLQQRGAPNYFGEQRFGRDNLEKARQLFAGNSGFVKRRQRGLYLSAARSWLFNRILAQRVEQSCWDEYLDGDVLQHDGKRSFFAAQAPEQEKQRLLGARVHPTGALYGTGKSPLSGKAAALEQLIFEQEPELCHGLEKAGLKHERRALRLFPRQLEWELDQSSATLELSFNLHRGEFATSVLRELLIYAD